MRTVTYLQIRNTAADLAGRPRDRLPDGEIQVLRAFFASELADIWTREAWPELCDHLESVTLASKMFSLREGAADEMGDILAIIEGGDPRTTTAVSKVAGWTRLDNRVNVVTNYASVYVDWQTPVTNLMATTYDTEATLNALTLPQRFHLPLAARGAALLLAEEDVIRAAALRTFADVELAKQAVKITNRPWWRQL